MNIFPINLPEMQGRHMFYKYIDQHRDELHEKYGHMVYATHKGVAGMHKLFSWEHVDVQVLSPTEVRFSIGTGERSSLTIDTEWPAKDLVGAINSQKWQLAEAEYEERQRAARIAAIEVVHHELFGGDKCTSSD